jgi:hypothetical protein
MDCIGNSSGIMGAGWGAAGRGETGGELAERGKKGTRKLGGMEQGAREQGSKGGRRRRRRWWEWYGGTEGESERGILGGVRSGRAGSRAR